MVLSSETFVLCMAARSLKVTAVAAVNIVILRKTSVIFDTLIFDL